MTEKQIIIIQLITGIMTLDDSGQEKEVELILNKLAKLKEIEEKEIGDAIKDDVEEGEIEESKDDGSII